MALPNVNIIAGNGGLGQLAASTDRVGIVSIGAAIAGLAMSTNTLLVTLKQAEQLGITLAAHPVLWRAIKEFYDEAGAGTELYLRHLPNTTTLVNLFTAPPASNTLIQPLLDYANGRIKVLSIVRVPATSYVPSTTANKIDIDVISALPLAQAYFTELWKLHKMCRFLLPAIGFTGDFVGLKDLKTMTANACAVVIGSTQASAEAAMGLVLGRIARIPVMRNIGRVKEGSLKKVTNAYIKVAGVIENINDINLTILNDKGYIFIRRYFGKEGYYFNNDFTSTAATDDYNRLARARVIDKAHSIVYNTYINELLDEVQIDDTGKIASGVISYMESIIEKAINILMTAAGEISAVKVFIDPNQNILATNKLLVKVSITPVGVLETIEVELGFYNPAA